MRVLFLTSRFPYPPHRGDKLKMFNLIRNLSQNNSVALLSFSEGAEDEQWIPELQKYCERVETVPRSRFRSLWNCILGLGGHLPFQVLYYSSPAMQTRLSRILKEWRPEVLHTHLIRMAPYTSDIQSVPRVLDLTDAVSLYLRRFRDMQGSPIARWVLGVEYKRMVRFEAVLSGFQRVLVCSEVDREALVANVPHAKLALLPNGVDREDFSPNGLVERDPNRIIFTGNMSYYPNADAAKYFVREIFPLVQRDMPDARLAIVGQNPPMSVRRLAGVHVDVTGFVRDLRAEYMKSSVAISPVRFGAGTLNKILEPLALGIPVVATPVSVQGMEPSQRGIVVGNTKEEFAKAVVRVLREPLYREEATRASAELRDRYGWDRIAKTLEGIYSEITKESFTESSHV